MAKIMNRRDPRVHRIKTPMHEFAKDRIHASTNEHRRHFFTTHAMQHSNAHEH
jgi:hypothetical protein